MTSVSIHSVDNEHSDLTKTAEDAPILIPKDPVDDGELSPTESSEDAPTPVPNYAANDGEPVSTVDVEDATTLEVEEVSMLPLISIRVAVEGSKPSKELFAEL